MNTLEIGFALVALTLGLAGWGLFLRRQWARREDEISIGYSDLERALDDLRTEFQHSVETTSSRATRIGERVLAAVKPIEVALRDFSSRIANVESRANASDQWAGACAADWLAQQEKNHFRRSVSK